MNSSRQDWVQPQTDDQARWLSDPERRRFLLPFLGRDRTTLEASVEVGCSLNVMFYRVRQLERAGLLTVVREQRRAGRAIKVYRTVSDRFFVPYGRISAPSLAEELQRQWSQPLRRLSQGVAQTMRHFSYEGQYLSRRPDGEVDYAGGPAPSRTPQETSAPLALDIMGELRLTRPQATEFRRGLIDLFRRCNQPSMEEAEPYRYALIFAPAQE